MDRRRASVLAVVAAMASALATMALLLVLGRPAAANHEQDEDQLWVTVAINAAGGDRMSVTDDTYAAGREWRDMGADVAVALGQSPDSFTSREDYDAALVELGNKLAVPDQRGGLSWSFDSGELQLLAQERGYEVLLLELCTPRVRQVVNALVTPESLDYRTPGTRCRGWFQFVDDPPIRAVVELSPDRGRYPRAVGRSLGTAAIAFGALGIVATLLRRGPLRRRRAASWVLAVASAVMVAGSGWLVVTIAMWWNGSAADPVLLSRGSIGEQVARTMLPGLAFLLPALLPAALLLTVPRREKPPPAPLPAWPGTPPPQQAPWWPQAWWPEWAAQHPQGQPPPPGWGAAAPSPAPPQTNPPPHPPPPAPPPSGWAPPGSSSG